MKWEHRPPHFVQLMLIMVLSMALMLTVVVKAFAEEEFTRDQKIEFLKMGLILNGGSTTTWGPVDLSRRGETSLPPPPKAVQTVPVKPEPEAKPVKQASLDICARHNMRKTVRGKTWRCRR